MTILYAFIPALPYFYLFTILQICLAALHYGKMMLAKYWEFRCRVDPRTCGRCVHGHCFEYKFYFSSFVTLGIPHRSFSFHTQKSSLGKDLSLPPFVMILKRWQWQSYRGIRGSRYVHPSPPLKRLLDKTILLVIANFSNVCKCMKP